MNALKLTPYTSQFDADYQKVLSNAQAQGIRFPSNACMTAQNALMVAIKANIGLSAFDQIKVLYGDGPSLFTDINWVNPSLLRTRQINNPLYTPLGGFDSDYGISSNAACLNMGVFDPNYTQNNCETIIYYKGLTANYGIYIDGTQGNVNNSTYNSINPTHSAASGGTIQVQVNDTNFTTMTGFDLTDGLYYFGRTAASGAGSIFARKGSAARVTASSTSNGVSPWGMVLGGYTNQAANFVGNGAPTARTYYLYTSGRLLTTTEEASFKTAWDTYMTAIAAIPAYSTVGTIYNVSSWANLNDFTVNGATVSATSNQLQFTAGANTFTQTLDLSSIGGTSIGSTKLSKWTQTIKFVVPTISGATNWIGVGLRSSNTAGDYYDLVFRMDLTTGTAGIMRLYTGPSHTLSASTTAVSITAGDIVSITLELKDGVAIYSGYNVTTGSTPITGTFGLYSTGGSFVTNTGHFAIFNGGNANVTSWTVSSGEYKYPKIAIIGDSKTQGYQATGTSLRFSIKNGFFYQMQNSFGPMVNLGGSSDDSRDFVNRTYEIINWIQPETVIIAGVSNDIRRGISSATWQANINSLISQFQAAGIRVVFWTGLYEGILNQSAVSTWANAGIGCDVWDSVGIVLTSSDNVHPDNAGHLKFSINALANGKVH